MQTKNKLPNGIKRHFTRAQGTRQLIDQPRKISSRLPHQRHVPITRRKNIPHSVIAFRPGPGTHDHE
jgi:hypothetical protein